MPEVSKQIITVSISKQELSQLPAAGFNGEVVLIDQVSQTAEAVACLRESDIIGFDTETRPSFRKGVINKVALMQLSTRERCYLFRINKIGIPDELRSLLEDPDKLKVGLSIHDDFHNIRNICQLDPQGFIDLQQFVKQFKIADNSLSRIYAILFGKRISKGQRLTNWEADDLTPNQQRYAALDAVACIEIYDRLTTAGFDPETSPYMNIHDEDEVTSPEVQAVRELTPEEKEAEEVRKREARRLRNARRRHNRKANRAARKKNNDSEAGEPGNQQ